MKPLTNTQSVIERLLTTLRSGSLAPLGPASGIAVTALSQEQLEHVSGGLRVLAMATTCSCGCADDCGREN